MFNVLLLNMIQLKVFYNISFPEGDRCEIISTEDNEIATFEDLMEILRRKIECLHFIPDEELRIQYMDDEDTFVNLRVGDSFRDALRCANAVPGSTFRRLKIKVKWQPKSTPEMISSKRREITERTFAMTGGELKKQLVFNDEKCNFSTSTVTVMNPSGFSDCFSVDYESDTKSPPRKQQRVPERVPAGVFVNNSPKEIDSFSVHSADKYKSPLDLLIQDKQAEIEKEREKVSELQRDLDRLTAAYGKHPGIDYSKPACTNCHRREGHNRSNCPYKGHACLSAQFCGDINKHKEEKDAVSAAANRLQSVVKSLQKLESTLAMKKALKNQTSNSFSSVVRTRLVSECRARYLTQQGFENWRQINQDLKKLEAHFKGKIPPKDISLIAALDEYNNKINPAQSEPVLGGNPVRTLWELKGIKWPTSSSSTESKGMPNYQARQLSPQTIQEEQEHLKKALIESRMSTVYRPASDERFPSAVEESEKSSLSDAASALVNLSDIMGSRKY